MKELLVTLGVSRNESRGSRTGSAGPFAAFGVLEPVAFAAGFQDVTAMREAVEGRSG